MIAGCGSTTGGRPERPHLLTNRTPRGGVSTDGRRFLLDGGTDPVYLYGKGEFDGIATGCHRGRTRLGIARSPTRPARSDRKRTPKWPEHRAGQARGDRGQG